MAKTIFSTVKSFCTAQTGAPAKALALTLDSMDHMIEHKDWDALAYFLGHGPSNMRPIAKRIVAACLGGVEYDSASKVARSHRCRGMFKMSENFGPTDRMIELRALVDAGEGLTSRAVKETFPSQTPDKTEAEVLASFVSKYKKLMTSIVEFGFDPNVVKDEASKVIDEPTF